MKTNFDLTKILQAGQTVYSSVFGYGTVISTSYADEGEEEYPICVKFTKENFAKMEFIAFREWFTKEGRYNQYASDDAECVLFPSKEERDWSKHMPIARRYDFKPFEMVLCRNYNDEQWTACHFSHYSNNDENRVVAVGGRHYYYCIPYKGNEHLVGTDKNEYYE